MARGETISAAMVLRLVKLLEARQALVEPMLARAGLSRAELEAVGARVSYADADRLLEAAARELGPGGLGVKLAFTQTEETYGAAGLLLVTGSTFRQGLARSLGYQRTRSRPVASTVVSVCPPKPTSTMSSG